MDPLRGRQNRQWSGEVIFTASDIRDASASFLADQPTSRYIPCIERKFPETVKTSCCNVCQIQRCGAEAAHALAYPGKTNKVGKIILWCIPGIVWEAGRQQAPM